MKLTVSPLAERDIEEIGDYIAQDKEVRIERVLHGARDIDSLFSESPEGHKS
ncbi:hypothetical protein [Brenneria roseae]|uniref:hypothetical protein n=1 Tax=Brenneria roseae TaxID=1509241 RepID=UPI001472CE52|nr:hypothetical protein [Brenneria roseae]